MEETIIISKDKKISLEVVLEVLTNLEKNILPTMEKQYFRNFLIAYNLSKRGYNNLSDQTIKFNKKVERELGNCYFLRAIINFDYNEYSFAKEFLGKNFDKYAPIEIGKGSAIQAYTEGKKLKVIETMDFDIFSFKKEIIDALDQQKNEIFENKKIFPLNINL
ncbi:hypothetical protein J4411_00830 [Candidatus Pacearchaeota archaeon]|nr:hypothetical protein [uncultured archaeon]MBS3084440.1 hypothetical protein [Candidatus Pacearchaeota archaeon]